MSQHTGYLCIILSSIWGRYSAKRLKHSSHSLKKVRCNSAIPNQQSSSPLLSLPEVIRPIFSHYWTIDVNLPNLKCLALSRYSYKKQPGYLRQSETEKYYNWTWIILFQQVLCLTVAALLHYFCLSAFCWMLIEGIMLYLLIIEVYNNELKLRLCYTFSFGKSLSEETQVKAKKSL